MNKAQKERIVNQLNAAATQAPAVPAMDEEGKLARFSITIDGLKLSCRNSSLHITAMADRIEKRRNLADVFVPKAHKLTNHRSTEATLRKRYDGDQQMQTNIDELFKEQSS